MIDHNFKKKFGQNFIKDQTIIDKIVKYSDILEDTLVIEIGPGAGSLTKSLCKSAKFVLAYEIDKDLENVLSSIKEENNNLNIIWDDFLKRNILEDISGYDYSHLYVIANLPYYITTPIITKFIEENISVDKMIVMVQKEVASRFLATPNTKNYGSLTVFLNYNFNIKKLFDVSRNVFVPIPNVDSSIVQFSKKEDKLEVKDIDVFYKLVRDSFKFKRKNLKNNLIGYDIDKVEDVLKGNDKDLTFRAENITLEEFVKISNSLVE